MNKFDKFIKQAEEPFGNDSEIDKFMFTYGKWFIVISMPFFHEMWWYERMATPTLWLWILIMGAYLFCAVFCFFDIYKLWKFIRRK